MRYNFSISPLFSSAKSSAFGGDFAAFFSIALSLDADTYSFGWYAIHPHSLLISFEKLCGGKNTKIALLEINVLSPQMGQVITVFRIYFFKKSID